MLTKFTRYLYLCVMQFSCKFEKNAINNKVIKSCMFTSITMVVDFEICRPQWHMAVWLWTDYCTLDNESLSILIISPKHIKTIEIVSLSDILNVFIFEPMRIQCDKVLNVVKPWFNSQRREYSSDSDENWHTHASHPFQCVLQIS